MKRLLLLLMAAGARLLLQRRARLLNSAALLVMLIVLPVVPAWSTPYTLTCGTPTGTGNTIGLTSYPRTTVGGDYTQTVQTFVTLPLGTFTAAGKCALIADALMEQGFTVSTSGNSITFESAGGGYALYSAGITTDTTLESNTLSMAPPSGDDAQLIVFPDDSSTIFPTAGTTFGISLTTPNLGTLPFLVTANGTQSEVALQQLLLSDITTTTGITFNPATCPINATATVTCFKSSYFDPAIVSIQWDANTGADLANFGLGVVVVSPEPGTLILAGTALAFQARRRIRVGEHPGNGTC